MRDLFMGMEPAMVSHVDVPKWWLLGYALAYHSPFDCVYKAVSTPRHPVRLFARFVESVDVAITLPGAFEKVPMQCTVLNPSSTRVAFTRMSAGCEELSECFGCRPCRSNGFSLRWRTLAVLVSQGPRRTAQGGVDEAWGKHSLSVHKPRQ